MDTNSPEEKLRDKCEAAYKAVEYVVHDFFVSMFCVENKIEPDNAHMVACDMTFDTSQEKITIELWLEEKLSGIAVRGNVPPVANDPIFDLEVQESSKNSVHNAYPNSMMPKLYEFLKMTESVVPQAEIKKLPPHQGVLYLKRAQKAIDELYHMAGKAGVLENMSEKPIIPTNGTELRSV